MGPDIIYTGHLVLKVENESKAKDVLNLYQRNRLLFERFEPTRPSDFYTLDYHYNMLRREYRAYLAGTFIRYYIYEAYHMTRIIGAVNFNLFFHSQKPYAEIGYKIDSLHQNRGYAYEACMAGIKIVSQEYGITNFHARILPDNLPSRHLAGKMGFTPVCTEPLSANVCGRMVDIIRYILDTSQIQ